MVMKVDTGKYADPCVLEDGRFCYKYVQEPACGTDWRYAKYICTDTVIGVGHLFGGLFQYASTSGTVRTYEIVNGVACPTITCNYGSYDGNVEPGGVITIDTNASTLSVNYTAWVTYEGSYCSPKKFNMFKVTYNTSGTLSTWTTSELSACTQGVRYSFAKKLLTVTTRPNYSGKAWYSCSTCSDESNPANQQIGLFFMCDL
jgi:hypothetical protein